MNNRRFYMSLAVRLLLLVCIITTGMLAFANELPYTAIFCGLVIVLLTLELFSFIRQRILFYDKTIDAILHEDFTADFSGHAMAADDSSLTRLYNSLKSRQNDQVTQDLVYRSILNTLESAVIILQRGEEDWNIFFSNDYFSKYFGVPRLNKWKYLKMQLPALCEIIEQNGFQDMRTSAKISTANDVKQTFMFQASRSVIFGTAYYILMLDSIQNIVAKNEKDAWINLMKVISHELMNSVTPIRSLSQNLHELIQHEPLTTEGLEEIRESVDTMIRRSDHLQNFIESYRTLAMLPSPRKEPVSLKNLVDSVMRLMKPAFEEEGVLSENRIESSNIVMADALQLEQVFINLFTNSLYAMADCKVKKIEVTLTETTDRVFVNVSDTGFGVDKEIEDKIFLPFFTTRKQGAGIGLTLSKNIIEGHGGYLHFKVEESRTCFTICLLR